MAAVPALCNAVAGAVLRAVEQGDKERMGTHTLTRKEASRTEKETQKKDRKRKELVKNDHTNLRFPLLVAYLMWLQM